MHDTQAKDILCSFFDFDKSLTFLSQNKRLVIGCFQIIKFLFGSGFASQVNLFGYLLLKILSFNVLNLIIVFF